MLKLNSTVCFISSKLRAQKTKTGYFIEGLDSIKRLGMLKVAMNLARKRLANCKRIVEIKNEIIRRIALKSQKKRYV